MRHRGQLARTILLSASLVALGAAGPAFAGSGHATAHHKAHAKKGTVVTSRKISLGRVLANPKGRVMYLFDKDTRGKSHCKGACAQAWPRVMSPAKPRAGHDVKAKRLARTSTHQATYYGHPLYYFIGDPKTSHTGEGESGFFLVSPSGKAVKPPKKKTPPGSPNPYVPPAPTSAAEVSSAMLVTPPTTSITDAATNRPLYYLSSESGSTFFCTASCQKTWIPLMTDGNPGSSSLSIADNLGTVTRADDNGETQVTFHGHAVYALQGDFSGYAYGDGDAGPGMGTWHLLSPSGTNA